MLATTQSVPGRAPRVSNRLRVMVAALAVALLCVPTAGAARGMLVGLLDEAALYDEPTSVFPLMEQARTQVLRLNLYWGGSIGVARAAAGAGDRSGRSGVRLDALRPHRQLRGAAQDPDTLLDLRDAGVGERRRRAQRSAARDRRPEQLRLCGREALQRPLPGRRTGARYRP